MYFLSSGVKGFIQIRTSTTHHRLLGTAKSCSQLVANWWPEWKCWWPKTNYFNQLHWQIPGRNFQPWLHVSIMSTVSWQYSTRRLWATCQFFSLFHRDEPYRPSLSLSLGLQRLGSGYGNIAGCLKAFHTGTQASSKIYFSIMRLNAIYGKKLNARCHGPAVFPQGGPNPTGALLVAKWFLQCCLLACGIMHPPTSPKGSSVVLHWLSDSVTGAGGRTVAGLPC